jgi:hypothetical protein
MPELRQRSPRVKDNKHREWIASLPCCVTGVQGQTQCAHLRAGTNAGMGMKSHDYFCVPLSWQEHDKQHKFPGGEIGYWEQFGGIDKAKALANALHVKSGDTDYAYKLLARFRK